MKNKRVSIYIVFFICSIFHSCTLDEHLDIEIDNIKRDCNTSIFHSICPDMHIETVQALLGPANEIELGTYDEDEVLIYNYYFKDHKLQVFKIENNERIEELYYIPYLSHSMHLKKFLANPQMYNINNETDFINIYHQDTLYYSIELSNMIIKSINYFILPI